MPFVYDIHLGNTRDKIIISEGKSSVLWSEISFLRHRVSGIVKRSLRP